MPKGFIVGLTGGIATGKSTVTNMLRELGAYVVDADVWARRVVEPGSEGLQKIIEAFGEEVIQDDGSLNRPALGALIFKSPKARQALNDITHPLVRKGMMRETTEYLDSVGEAPVVWDVPLLFEGETQRLVQETILVYVDEETQLLRLMKRNGLRRDEALERIKAQMPIDDKRALATYIIDNRSSVERTREQVETTWEKIKTLDRGVNLSWSE